MLTANLAILSSTPGIDDAHLVVVGVAIEETDTALPNQYVSADLDWGDGTVEEVIEPQESPVWAAVTVQRVQTKTIVALTLTPSPYAGTFNLLYDGEAINGLAYNVSNVALVYAIRQKMPSGSILEISGTSPAWRITFETAAAATLLTVGSNALKAYHPLTAHLYPYGNYVLALTARNLRSPVSDEVAVSVPLSVSASPQAPPNLPILIGPILPADVGFPNPGQWNFDTSHDIKVLASNVKMILITEPGDRVMLPDYGCALRQFLFDPLDASTTQDIAGEIRRAIELWEPRVRTEDIDLQRQERSIIATVTLVSNLDQQRFQLNVEIER